MHGLIPAVNFFSAVDGTDDFANDSDQWDKIRPIWLKIQVIRGVNKTKRPEIPFGTKFTPGKL